MNLKTDMKVNNESECFEIIFSEDLFYIARYVIKYFSDIKVKIDEDHDLALLYAFVEYLDSHDFDEMTISFDFTSRVPFPHLPSLLLACEDVRKEFIQQLETDFPTSCAALFIRDVTILESLYDFAIETGIFDLETNNLIEHINNFYKKLENVYNNNIKSKLKKAIKEEVEEYINIEFEYLDEEELYKIYNINRGNLVNGYSDFYTMLDEYSLYYIEKIGASTILGDLDGIPIGETIDIYSLYPFTLTISKNIISGIKWKPQTEGN